MLAVCGQEKASYLTVLVNFFEWCYMWKCDDANTSGTPDCVLPCANSSSVQGSLIELAIVQATSYWVIPGQVITKNGRPPSDFNETWYIHTLSEVINPHPFLASYVIWLLSYNFSKIAFFGKFSVNL